MGGGKKSHDTASGVSYSLCGVGFPPQIHGGGSRHHFGVCETVSQREEDEIGGGPNNNQ